MDFIERALGLSPDGGSGMLEAALVLAPILLAAAIRFRHSGTRMRKRRTTAAEQ